MLVLLTGMTSFLLGAAGAYVIGRYLAPRSFNRIVALALVLLMLASIGIVLKMAALFGLLSMAAVYAIAAACLIGGSLFGFVLAWRPASLRQTASHSAKPEQQAFLARWPDR